MTLGLLTGSEPDNVQVHPPGGQSEPHKCWACNQWLADGLPPSWHLDPETGEYACPMPDGP